LQLPTLVTDLLPDPLTSDDEDRLIRAACQPSRVDRVVVDSLATILAAQRRAEDSIGSGPLVAPVVAQLGTITRLAAEARGAIRPALVDVAAQWAQFAGWLSLSVRALDHAQRWYDRAAEWSAEADNRDLTANILSFRGYMAWLMGRPGPTVGLSQAALRVDGAHAGQRAYDAIQEARGLAMTGEVAEADRALGRAGELLASISKWSKDLPSWSYYYSGPLYAMEEGLVYRLLGRTAPREQDRRSHTRLAIDTLTAGLEGLPPEMRGAEWSGEFRHQLGLAYRQAGELDQVEVLREELRVLSERLASDRLAAQAETL
jgi:hypothetical protein